MDAAAEHRQIAGEFTALVVSADPARWDDPAPVQGWTARDVVGHLVEWFPAFLQGAAGITLPGGPSTQDDPVAAWAAQTAAVQALLDDPAAAATKIDDPHLGPMTLEQATAQIYTNDVFLHTWDLARATGQPVALDEERCARMLDGMQPMDEMLRQSGQYGPKVDVPQDAPAMERLMGFIGRDPGFGLD